MEGSNGGYEKMRFLAFDIGCLECGEESAVIGFYDTEGEAGKACAVAAKEQEKTWHGQHSFRVFEVNV
jgi:hypothetical protein